MNRKAKSKALQKVDPIPEEHPYDDIRNWLRADYANPPWPKDKIQRFQKQIDSAFGAENAFLLVWSGDRTYGDAFLNEKGVLERKPILLFAEVPVNDEDYIYISCPRWCIVEVLHGSQLEDGWEEASFITDASGITHRVRPEKPPEFFYKHVRTIATHERPIVRGDEPPCCKRMWDNGRNICYGKYKLPSEDDIAFIRRIRERLDDLGIAQRADAPRSAKVLQFASLATKHYMESAAKRKKKAVQDMILSDPKYYMGDVLKNYNVNWTAPEIDRTLKEGFEREEI